MGSNVYRLEINIVILLTLRMFLVFMHGHKYSLLFCQDTFFKVAGYMYLKGEWRI